MSSFSKAYRLVSKQDFQSVFARSTRISGSSLLALCCSSLSENPRLGMVISKRYVKTAVARNRIKRVIRESFRHHLKQLGGLDIIVLPRKTWSTETQQQLQDEMKKLWQAVIAAKIVPSHSH
jgi:ribonuclease P protein component